MPSTMRLLRRGITACHKLWRPIWARPVAARSFSDEAVKNQEYMKRNYADNIAEYNTVLGSIIWQRRYRLLRDVYDDMVLDGVQPTRDTFHSLVMGSMRGGQLQDAFFFRDEMKKMGMVPDVALYNYLISACGKCKISDTAVHLLEEMKGCGVKPNGQTYVCLLNAFASTGRTDRVYAIVRDMTAAGLGLNKYCYAGLITAHKNKIPPTDETNTKIVELVKQSKGWSSVETSSNSAENITVGISEEELYNLATAEYAHRRRFLDRQQTVYHAACYACADLRTTETLEKILDLLKQDKKSPDSFVTIHSMRCYLHCGDIDRGIKIFDDFLSSRPPFPELYSTLALGAMHGNTPQGMEVALSTLEKMKSNGFFLTNKNWNELLTAASAEETGGFTTANYIWDLMVMGRRKIVPSISSVEAYLNGLKRRQIPENDGRLLQVVRTYDNLMARVGPVHVWNSPVHT